MHIELYHLAVAIGAIDVYCFRKQTHNEGINCSIGFEELVAKFFVNAKMFVVNFDYLVVEAVQHLFATNP